MVTGTSRDATAPAGRPARPRQGPFTRWPRTADAALAAAVFLIEVIAIVGRMGEERGEFDLRLVGEVPIGVYLLLAVSSVALLWRRSRPLIVAVATLTASVVWDVVGYAEGPSLAIFISLYGVGRYIADDRTSLLSLAAALILVVADDVIEGEQAPVIALSLGLVLLAWYAGRRVEGRRAYLALVEERAEYLERERMAEAQRAVDEERTRIARELHDLVAHRVSMITVQAGAAQTVAASDPERAMRAMESVEEAGREALDELRQILGVLRASDERKGLAPMHGIAEISGLVADMAGAGMDVSLSQDGLPANVPSNVDLAAYRIVQEALTNVLKHAGPGAKAEVRLSANDQMLTIEVTDRGVGVSTLPGSGHGLIGMRERATMLGGAFEAGRRPGGGFRIEARLPLERSPS